MRFRNKMFGVELVSFTTILAYLIIVESVINAVIDPAFPLFSSQFAFAAHSVGCDPNAVYETLGEGDQGPLIFGLQSLLLSIGFDPVTVDGIFGANTKAEVEKFQQYHNLTVDGIVGPQTWEALCSVARYTLPE